MPALRMAARTPSATFSTIAGRPISSGKISALIAVPMTSRDLSAGPVLALRANTVACGVMTPSQPPDQTIGICVIVCFGAAAELLQHRAERLVGEDAGEIVDAAIAFGLADHGDDFVGAELALFDQRLHAGRVLHVLQFDFGDFDGHYVSVLIFSLVMRGPDPRIHADKPLRKPCWKSGQVQSQNGLPGQVRRGFTPRPGPHAGRVVRCR